MAKGKYEEWLTEEGLVLLEGWARDGLTDKQIAHNMGVSYSTFRVYRDKYTAISAAVKKGKAVADYIVENALFRSATGYTIKLQKPIKIRTEVFENGRRVITEKIEYALEEVHIAANPTSQIYWLKNRKPEVWRDKPAAQVAESEDSDIVKALRDTYKEISNADK